MDFVWHEPKRQSNLHMNENSTSPISDELDEAPPLTAADFAQARFRIGLKEVPREQPVSLYERQ
jgi:hypothetical protein